MLIVYNYTSINQNDRQTMSNKLESAMRLRYIRVLERFLKSIVAYLSIPEGITKEGYEKKVENNLRYLQKTQNVQLYKGEFSDLEELVKEMISKASSEESIEDIKSSMLYKANKLEQTKNNRKYKKDKHKADMFKEW